MINLQITNLKAFKIPPALFYTFLKIEINHWEILEIAPTGYGWMDSVSAFRSIGVEFDSYHGLPVW
jgi:hypothetical protein